MKSKLLPVFALLVLFSQPVFSHSPIDIEMERDLENNRISVAVNHPSGSPHSHYIKKIEVVPGSLAPITKIFRFQKANHQRTNVDIPGLEKVASIVIKAYCNKGGFLSREFKFDVKKQKTDKHGAR